MKGMGVGEGKRLLCRAVLGHTCGTRPGPNLLTQPWNLLFLFLYTFLNGEGLNMQYKLSSELQPSCLSFTRKYEYLHVSISLRIIFSYLRSINPISDDLCTKSHTFKKCYEGDETHRGHWELSHNIRKSIHRDNIEGRKATLAKKQTVVSLILCLHFQNEIHFTSLPIRHTVTRIRDKY